MEDNGIKEVPNCPLTKQKCSKDCAWVILEDFEPYCAIWLINHSLEEIHSSLETLENIVDAF